MASKSELLAGYECSFVEDFPKDFQSECSVCLNTLRQPYMVGCCGFRFCHTCIEPIQSKGSPCPLCKSSFSSLPDRQLERILNDWLVYCSYKDDGCVWKDKLKELDDHLKQCSYQDVPCSYCRLLLKRMVLKDHEENCSLRPMLCTYCKVYKDTRVNLAVHYNECPMYPVLCPNNCGASPFRRNISKHTDSNCPNSMVDCFFKYAGCEMQVVRREMSDHFNENSSDHFAMAVKTIKELREENTKLKAELRQSRLARQSEDCQKEQPVESGPIQYLAVTNLPPAVNEWMLNSVFGQYGVVDTVHLSEDKSHAKIVYISEQYSKAALSTSNEIGIRLKSHTLCLTPMYN